MAHHLQTLSSDSKGTLCLGTIQPCRPKSVLSLGTGGTGPWRAGVGSGLLAPPTREKSHVCLNVMQQLTEQVQTAEQGKRDEKPRKDQRFLVLTRTPEQRTKCAKNCLLFCYNSPTMEYLQKHMEVDGGNRPRT